MEDGKRIPDDEIDMGALFRKLKIALLYPFVLWRTNIKTTLAFIFAGVLVAVALKFFVTRTYRSSFVIRPNDIHEKFHLKMLGDIQLLLRNSDHETIASELNLETGAAKSITELRVVNPFIKNRTDSLNHTEVFIETTDFKQFIPIQNGIMVYLENNPYFRKITELSKQQTSLNLAMVEKDLLRLDQLKQLQMEAYARDQRGNQQFLLLNDLVNPTAVYGAADERMNKKAMLSAQMVFLNNFQLVKSCVVVKKHAWPPRILVTSAVTIPVFLLIGFIYLHFRRRA